MGLFNRKRTDEPVEQPLTLDEQSENMKAVAIEYMVSLDKADLTKFIDGVDQVWQGYNNNLDKVRTRHQKALHRDARQAGIDDDSDLVALLEDKPNTPKQPATTKAPTTEAK